METAYPISPELMSSLELPRQHVVGAPSLGLLFVFGR